VVVGDAATTNMERLGGKRGEATKGGSTRSFGTNIFFDHLYPSLLHNA
jgi:hypothetical protein